MQNDQLINLQKKITQNHYLINLLKSAKSQIDLCSYQQLRKIYFQSYTYILLQPDQQIKKQRMIKLQADTKLKYKYCCTTSDALQEIITSLQNNQEFLQTVIIVCDLSFAQEVSQRFSKYEIVSQVLCFGWYQFQQQQRPTMLQLLGPKFKQTLNPEIAIKLHITDPKTELITNFVMFRFQSQKGQQLLKLTSDMIVHKGLTNFVIPKLCQFVKSLEVYDDQQVQKFQQIYKEADYKQLKCQQALKIYTGDSFLYKLMNKILKVCTKSKQLYYFQPIFRDIYKSILTLQKQQQFNPQLLQFKCYRGGYINYHQLKVFQNNKGQFFQNLGFLSASLKKNKAIDFAINVFFVIHVKNDWNKYKAIYNRGFALIKDYSDFSSQQQILFNPLNTFKIEKVENSFSYKDKVYCFPIIYLSTGSIHDFQLNNFPIKSQKIKQQQINLHYQEKIQTDSNNDYLAFYYQQKRSQDVMNSYLDPLFLYSFNVGAEKSLLDFFYPFYKPTEQVDNVQQEIVVLSESDNEEVQEQS